MITILSMIASIIPWGIIATPLGTTAQIIGVVVQIFGLLVLVLIGSSGNWMRI